MAAEPPNEVRLNLRPPLDLAVTSRCAENNSRLNSAALGSRSAARHLTKGRPADLRITEKDVQNQNESYFCDVTSHNVIGSKRTVSIVRAVAPPLRSQFAKTTTPYKTTMAGNAPTDTTLFCLGPDAAYGPVE